MAWQPGTPGGGGLALPRARGCDRDRSGQARRSHPEAAWKKADAAAELYGGGVLPRDFSSTLWLLNEARKVATYEGDEPDLEGRSLEDVAADVEAAVELAEKAASS